MRNPIPQPTKNPIRQPQPSVRGGGAAACVPFAIFAFVAILLRCLGAI